MITLTACQSDGRNNSDQTKPPAPDMTVMEPEETDSTPVGTEPPRPKEDLTFHSDAVDGYQHQTSNVGAYDVYFTFLNTGDDIPVNDPVALNIVVVDQNGRLIPESVSLNVDAAMPHHRHGVVRIPTVTRTRPGEFHVEGVLFHMPGRWELYFDVTELGRTERTQVELMLE